MKVAITTNELFYAILFRNRSNEWSYSPCAARDWSVVREVGFESSLVGPSLQNISKILVVAFLDSLAYALFAPTLAVLFFPGPGSLLPEDFNHQEIIFGCYVSSYSVAQVLCLGFWGRKAQVWGPKRVLMIALAGGLVGYLLSAFAVSWRLISLLFLGVFVSGSTGANMAMIHSMIATTSSKRSLSGRYSLLGAVVSSAFVVGPQITGLLTDWVAIDRLYFYIFAVCSLVSIIDLMIVGFWVERPKVGTFAPAPPVPSFSEVIKLVFNSQSGLVSLSLFGVFFGWFFFLKFFQVYVLEIMGMDEKICCYLSSFFGVCCALWQGGRFFLSTRGLTAGKLGMLNGFLIMALSLIGLAATSNLVGVMLLMALISMGYAMTVPSLMSLGMSLGYESPSVKSASFQAIRSGAQILAPLLSGLAMSVSDYLPLVISSCLMLLAGVNCAMVVLGRRSESEQLSLP